MDDQEMKDDVNQLKEQMSKVLELLQSLNKDKAADGISSAVNNEDQAIPSHPPGFSPMQLQYGLNAQGMMVPFAIYPYGPTHSPASNPHNQTPQFPLYGLPPGYTPPVANDGSTNHHPQGSQIQQFPQFGLPPGYTPPGANNNSAETDSQTLAVQEVAQPQGSGSGTETIPVQNSTPAFTTYTFPPSYIPPLIGNAQGIYAPVVTPIANPRPFGHSYYVQGNPLNPQTNCVAWTPAMGGSNPSVPVGNQWSDTKLQILEDRLKAVEGVSYLGSSNASDLCLVPDVVVPPKFKVPDFDKYKGTTCPKSHLTMYCRKMASYAHDDKLLVHFFQDSLTGAVLSWYTHLERSHIRCWKDLADAFLKQYKYNIDMAPDRMQLQNMAKRDDETFKEYAQRWRRLAAQVEPPLIEKEMVAMFMDTLQSPFYDKMIGSVSSNFSDMVIVGEKVEGGMRNGKIAHNSAGINDVKKPPTNFMNKKEGETNAVMTSLEGQTQGKPPQFFTNFPQPFPYPYFPPPYIAAASHNPPTQLNQNQKQPNDQEKKLVQFDPIPMTYTDLFHLLISNSLISPRLMKPLQPPFPRGYDPNSKCEFHAGAIGHTTENCKALKYVVKDLINSKLLSFKEDGPNVGNNPLPGHGGPTVNAITEEFEDQPLIARLEGREPKDENIPICDITQSFQSAGMLNPNQIAAIKDDRSAEDDVDNLVHPCPPNEELGNWEIAEFPVIFDSK